MQKRVTITIGFLLFLQFLICPLVYGVAKPEPKPTATEIATAGHEELVRLASQAGLAIFGSDDELRSALYQHYSLASPKAGKMELTSARRIYHGQITGLAEPVTRLHGGVKVKITEDQNIHQISAENIVIYQKAQAIYASGGVHYELVKGDGSQTFFAKNMMFHSKDWNSLLVEVHGQTLMNTSDGQRTTFYITAKKIEKTASGLVLADKIIVTSCNKETPHYHLGFRRLWALNDKEAVVQNMTLSFSGVPIFYLPYYYHGHDVFWMNPVVGVRTPEGLFFNTTTYLYGKKSAQDNSGGLFNILNDANGAPDFRSDDPYCKLMLDYYCKTGVFGGLAGSFPRIDTSFRVGIAYTRTLFEDQYFYPLDNLNVADLKREVNTSAWFGVKMPFRYGIEWTGRLWNIDYNIEDFSDIEFLQDFYFRQESPAFFGFVGNIWGDNSIPQKTQLENSINFRRTWNFNKPGLSTIALDQFQFDMRSNTKRNTALSESSPNRYFYTPYQLNLPNVQMRVEGDIPLNKKKKRQSTSTENNKETNSPSEQESSAKALFLQENNLELIKLPYSSSIDRLWAHSLFYRWRINEQVYYQPDKKNWNKAEDVKLLFNDVCSLSVTQFNFGFRSQLNDNTFRIAEGLQIDGQYLTNLNNYEKAKAQSEWINNQLNRLFTLSNVLDTSYYPLKNLKVWEKTGFDYNLTALMYENKFNRNDNARIATSTFTPTRHVLKGQLRYDNGQYWGYFATDSELPPKLAFKTNSKLGLGVNLWGIKTDVYTYVNRNTTTFDATGYGVEANYSPLEKLSLYSTLESDWQRGFARFLAGTQVYGFSVEWLCQEQDIWEFNKRRYTWDAVLGKDGYQKRAFAPYTLELRYKDNITLFRLPNDKGRFSLNVDTKWTMDLARYNYSSLRFNFGIQFDITDLLRVQLNAYSTNRASHIYFPFMRDTLGIGDSVNFFEDLWNSFKLWDTQARQRSNFKLENVNASIILDLHDWLLSLTYTGSPHISVGTVKSNWKNRLTFLVTWKAIPAVKMSGIYEDPDVLSLDRGKTRDQ